ncbi:hypothetical protein ACEWY4_018577 [Coilia grayii]|uniref:G-protein coupled receptors family 1 profile domain-containing protein n=1 Tax=Coilia grayii TaxID=363190 RepID=A0ABD1JDY0_9TELE
MSIPSLPPSLPAPPWSPKVSRINTAVSRKREQRVLVMVITMVVAYLLCWLPYGVMALVATFGRPGLVTPEASIIPSILAKFSTVINPVIYIFMNNQIAEEEDESLSRCHQPVCDLADHFSAPSHGDELRLNNSTFRVPSHKKLAKSGQAAETSALRLHWGEASLSPSDNHRPPAARSRIPPNRKSFQFSKTEPGPIRDRPSRAEIPDAQSTLIVCFAAHLHSVVELGMRLCAYLFYRCFLAMLRCAPPERGSSIRASSRATKTLRMVRRTANGHNVITFAVASAAGLHTTYAPETRRRSSEGGAVANAAANAATAPAPAAAAVPVPVAAKPTLSLVAHYNA